ncbi:MAG: hypothetical protein AABZ06_12730 [Bdellovibrionota bacterium]
MEDDEFTRKFHAQPTLLRKIQLAIMEDRYTIWSRYPPNFPDEYLKPILYLPDNTPVVMKVPRRSSGAGLNFVLELKYMYREMGRTVPIYLKGYFVQDDVGKLIISFAIQSLKKDGDNL